jgi:hypothetical protein
MGLSLLSSPSFNRYLKNTIPYKSKDSIKTFSIGLEFFGSAEYGVSQNFAARLDYSYFIKSIRYVYSYLVFDYFYFLHQPALSAFYLINGRHFQFKLGGGLSYQFIQLENNDLTYKSHGLGLRGEVIYSAQLSDRLNSYISGFIFGNFSNSVKDADGKPLISPVGEEVNLNAFGIGTRLGVSFYFN